ncbi:MAG: hypothetical protein HND57_10790 [Planctomycetes bacterium]|nr:hypothetical protein [Planctomycetota bacterium]
MVDTDPLLYWVIGLFVIAIAIFVIELFVPSGGILGVAALIFALAGVATAFKHSAEMGAAASGFLIVATPCAFWLFLKVFPHTPVGRRLILSDDATDSDEARAKRDHEKHDESTALSALVGATGIAVTDLKPGGTVRIDGQDVEAFADLGMIAAHTNVVVTRIVGRQIRVQADDNQTA